MASIRTTFCYGMRLCKSGCNKPLGMISAGYIQKFRSLSSIIHTNTHKRTPTLDAHTLFSIVSCHNYNTNTNEKQTKHQIDIEAAYRYAKKEIDSDIKSKTDDDCEIQNSTMDTLDKEISKSRSLQKFLLQTYKYTAGGVVGTLGVSQLLSCLMTTETMIENFVPIFGTGTVITLGSVLVLSTCFNRPVYLQSKHNAYSYKLQKLAWFSSMAIGNGIVLAPMISLYASAISPAILPAATCLTISIFAGASLYAYKLPSKALLPLTASLTGGLFGLIGIQLCAIVGPAYFGMSNEMYELLNNVDIYGGLALFTAFVAYDTQASVNSFKNRTRDAIDCSVELYLDFINILIRIMEILAKSKNKK